MEREKIIEKHYLKNKWIYFVVSIQIFDDDDGEESLSGFADCEKGAVWLDVTKFCHCGRFKKVFGNF